MLRLSMSAHAAELSRRQRTRALKSIISPRLVKKVLKKTRSGARGCPVVPDEIGVWLIIGLSLFCTDAIRQVWRWLVAASARLDVPQRSTLCMARQRLGTRVLVELAKAVLHPLAGPATPVAFYKGMALRGVDCCNLSIYDSPANRAVFSPPREPRRKRKGGRRPPPAFPQAKLCCLCELGTHAMLHWGLKPSHWADSNMAPPLLKHLRKGELLMWDAGFYSPANLKLVLRQEAHLLGRLAWSHKPMKTRALSDGSYLAELPIGRRGHTRLYGLAVRIIEYKLRGVRSTRHKKHRLVTTLTDERRYPAVELAELYHRRWELEVAIDELETHQLQQRVLVSQTPAGVVQEVAGLLMAHWLVRKLMFDAAAAAKVPPLRISFTGALKILRCRLGEAGQTPAGQRRWWKRLVAEVASDEVLEPRRPRINPRVLKRTTFDFPKKKPRDRGPQPTMPEFRKAFHVGR